MTELITIQGTAQESGKKIQGYALPKNISDFKTPSTILFAPNYTPILYKEEIGQNNGKPISIMKQVQVTKKSVNIVDKNISRDWLITDEGLILKWINNPNLLLISPSNTPASSDSSSTTKDVTKDTTIVLGSLEKKARNMQIVGSLLGWGIFGFLAYKFWNKSTVWKVVIAGLGISNAYYSYKAFSGSKSGSTNKSGSTSSGSTSSTGSGSTATVSNDELANKVIDNVKSMVIALAAAFGQDKVKVEQDYDRDFAANKDKILAKVKSVISTLKDNEKKGLNEYLVFEKDLYTNASNQGGSYEQNAVKVEAKIKELNTKYSIELDKILENFKNIK